MLLLSTARRHCYWPFLSLPACSEEEIMVDIDSFLEGELASINEVLEQFQTDDQKAKKRNLDEEKTLMSHANATVSIQN